MSAPTIYLDHAATTPLLPQAADAMARGFAIWANPSSPHRAGRAARAALEDARARIAAALDWPGEVILTAGASEALAIALGRATVDRRIVSAVEHDAVLRAAPDAAVLPMAGGEPDADALAAALAAPGRAVVAIQHTNSETGTMLLPLLRNATIDRVHAAGGLVLCDASQLGPLRHIPDGVDLVSMSAHAADMLKAMRDSSARMGVGTVPAVTLHTEKGVISFFNRDDLTMLVFHRDRGFVPGVREKMAAVLGELTKARLTLPVGTDEAD